MNLSGGWVQLRRGLVQHLHEGQLTPNEFLAFVLMLTLADSDTGIWTGCSSGLSFVSGGQVSAKAAKDALRSLEAKGYICRDRTQGQRGIHPILLDKYVVTTGNLRGKRLSLAATRDCKHPQYESVPDAVREKEPEAVRDNVPYTITQQIKKPIRGSQVGSAPSLAGRDSTNVVVAAEAEALAQFLCADVLRLSEPSSPATFSRMTLDASAALASRPLADLKQLLTFARDTPWWSQRLTNANYPMAFFAKSLDELEEQFKAATRPKKPAPVSHSTAHADKPGVAEAMKFLKRAKKK